MALDCTGKELPSEMVTTPQPSSPKSFDDFCIVVTAGEEILLHQDLSGKKLYYWCILQADDYSLAVCELENYANYAETKQQWSGKRADYLVMGYTDESCYLIVVELRHVLVKEAQEDQKFEQLKQSIQQIIQRREIFRESQALDEVYHQPESYRVIGVVIAPGNTRRFRRGELNQVYSIGSHKVLIRTLPKDALLNCKITWSDLLQRAGVIPGRTAGPLEFEIPAKSTEESPPS